MRLLLDSHVVLWWLENNVSLGASCRELIGEADVVYVSAVTPWELGIKRALGKLSFPEGLLEAISSSGFVLLSIAANHAERAETLPMHHRDPFDRMLVAQAQLEALRLVSADRSFAPYDIAITDARE